MAARILTPSLAVKERAVVRKIRELPLPGQILVKLGDLVTGDDIVASTSLPGELHILRLPEKMGIEPSEIIEGLKVKVGDKVREGDILCEHSGLFGFFKTQFKSPVSGVVELITNETGHVGVREPPDLKELDAYISGRVVEVIDKKSVTIESVGRFVQGIFGVGGERIGRIQFLKVNSSEHIQPKHIPTDCQASILIGGTNPSYEALKCASDFGAVGFITGAIDDGALKSYLGYDLGIALTGDEDVPMTLIVTEGFGALPMSDKVITTLKPVDGKVASINGATQVRAGALRPEIIVSEDSETTKNLTEITASELAIGTTIRIIRVPYFGEIGTITDIPQAAEPIQTGAITRVLKARLGNGEVVTVPRANVEIS